MPNLAYKVCPLPPCVTSFPQIPNNFGSSRGPSATLPSLSRHNLKRNTMGDHIMNLISFGSNKLCQSRVEKMVLPNSFHNYNNTLSTIHKESAKNDFRSYNWKILMVSCSTGNTLGIMIAKKVPTEIGLNARNGEGDFLIKNHHCTMCKLKL